MSKPKNTSAFPQLTWECPQGATTAFHFTRGGLSKRELFAAMAMQGVLAAHSGTGVPMPNEGYTASMAVKYADAVLSRLAETEGK